MSDDINSSLIRIPHNTGDLCQLLGFLLFTINYLIFTQTPIGAFP